MRYRVLQHIASMVLLATYLPMVLVSSLHVHHETIDTHDDCLQCAGHFENHHHHEHDCLYCHIITLDYLGQDAEQSAVILPVKGCCTTAGAVSVELPHYRVAPLRAPPLV